MQKTATRKKKTKAIQKEEANTEQILTVTETPKEEVVTLPAPVEPDRKVAIRPLAGGEAPTKEKPKIIPQPTKDEKGHYSKEDAKALKTVFLFQDPENNGGTPVVTFAVPDKTQRPYWYKDKIAWLGLKQLFSNRLPMYIMQEIKDGDKYGYAAYEPDALSPEDFSPSRRYRDTDWSAWRSLILHRAAGWKDIIRTGLIIAGIIGVVVFFWLAWSNVRKTSNLPIVTPITSPAPVIPGGIK